MLDSQNQGPYCTACGSPMKLTAIEPSTLGQDLRTFGCPRCKRVERHIIDSAVTEAWLVPKKRGYLSRGRPLGTISGFAPWCSVDFRHRLSNGLSASPALGPFLWTPRPESRHSTSDLSRLADITGVYWVITAHAFGFTR
jgi:hypothetical protein